MRAALDAGQVAGAAFDVFTDEPATENPLFGHPNVVCTPHLGAATSEAQENVALQVAEQMSDYLLRGAISNAVNFPSITAEEAPRAEAVHRARRKARLVRRPAHRDRHQESADRATKARSAQHEDQGADLGGARRPAAADAAGRQRGVGAGRRQGARHRRGGNDARGRRRLREPDHADGDDRAAEALGRRHGLSPTAARASSTSRASAWTPNSAPR